MKYENIIVTGKSGAGKQPRIDVLINEFGLKQLSTGNIFRHFLGLFKNLESGVNPEDYWDEPQNSFKSDEEIKDALKSACEAKNVNIDDAVLGLKATRFVDAGLFVPDYITNSLFEAEFRKNDGKGLILDGYPRTTAQAEFLLDLTDKMGVRFDFILLVDNEDEAIIKRTVGRRICKNCGKVFHMEYKPPKDGKFCTECGTEVVQRSDDTEEKIIKRLNEFKVKTLPTIEYLEAKGLKVVKVPGNLPVFTDEAVRESVLSALNSTL